MKRTALYHRHIALGAKIVPFAGWDMPIQYKGILEEHRTVREKVGLFDVSHMGRLQVQGPDAEKLLDYVSTNRLTGKLPGTATYTVWCHEDGGAIDDVIVFKKDSSSFFVMANAINKEKDDLHLLNQVKKRDFNVQIQAENHVGIIALQGPSACSLLASFLPEVQDLKPMHFLTTSGNIVISRTGYTGAGGYELSGAENEIIKWWDQLLEKGEKYGIQPIGLGARDTLRLEMGFALYGHELTDQIAPNESVSFWTIKWDKPEFLGKRALESLEKNPQKRWPYGVRMLEKGIARQGCQVFYGGDVIGEVTSGSYSPTLELGIGLILVKKPLQIGAEVAIQIRQKLYHAQVVELPFVRKTA